ncbi:hypothetical protein BJX66DRAFT_62655 [Aspergillus keveii]|uniref:Uncharacterized protein n=1 Tax=Aspergillus keveii TaxID=714993 RepID=A0ABR4GG76_9EURO
MAQGHHILRELLRGHLIPRKAHDDRVRSLVRQQRISFVEFQGRSPMYHPGIRPHLMAQGLQGGVCILARSPRDFWASHPTHEAGQTTVRLHVYIRGDSFLEAGWVLSAGMKCGVPKPGWPMSNSPKYIKRAHIRMDWEMPAVPYRMQESFLLALTRRPLPGTWAFSN